jgi:hypothetical protein
MKGHGSKFTRKMEAAVAALMTQRNMEEAARVAGIGTQTLLRWLKVPEFQAAYREARRAAVSQSNARAQQASSAAVSVLMKTMVDVNVPPAVRTRAAFHILSLSNQSIATEDIGARVAALEQASNRPPQDGPIEMSLTDLLRHRTEKRRETEAPIAAPDQGVNPPNLSGER